MKDLFIRISQKREVFQGVWLISALATLKVAVGDALYVALPIFFVLSALATVFPILYAVCSRGLWRFSQAGRTMMTQGVVMLFLLDFTLLQYFGFMSKTFVLYASIVLYTGLALVKVSLIKMVLHNRIPKFKRKQKKEMVA